MLFNAQITITLTRTHCLEVLVSSYRKDEAKDRVKIIKTYRERNNKKKERDREKYR